jgi:hypothetical protein
MASEIIVAPTITLSEFSVAFNSSDEMLITAKDSSGNDISRSGGLPMPPCPFVLAYNPENKDWLTIPLQEFPDGYKMVTCIIKAN